MLEHPLETDIFLLDEFAGGFDRIGEGLVSLRDLRAARVRVVRDLVDKLQRLHRRGIRLQVLQRLLVREDSLVPIEPKGGKGSGPDYEGIVDEGRNGGFLQGVIPGVTGG